MEGTLALNLSNNEWRAHKQLVSHFLARRTDATLTLSHLTHTHLLPLERLLSLSHKQWRTHYLKLTSTAHTHKEGTPPSHSHSHTQIEGHTPLTLTSHTHRVEGVRLIHNYTCAHFQTHNGGLLLSQTHSRAISHTERRTHSLFLSLKHRMKHILTLTLTTETEWTAHSLSHTYSHSLTRRLEGTLTHTRRLVFDFFSDGCAYGSPLANGP